MLRQTVGHRAHPCSFHLFPPLLLWRFLSSQLFCIHYRSSLPRQLFNCNECCLAVHWTEHVATSGLIRRSTIPRVHILRYWFQLSIHITDLTAVPIRFDRWRSKRSWRTDLVLACVAKARKERQKKKTLYPGWATLSPIATSGELAMNQRECVNRLSLFASNGNCNWVVKIYMFWRKKTCSNSVF
jgi:hypothetical protein